jgi:transcriptional regulator of acetoin/glycerol metabolism
LSRGVTTRSMLNALNNAILSDNITVEHARVLLMNAYRGDDNQEVQQMVEMYPTASAAAQAMGISRATLYKRLARAKTLAKAMAAVGGR